MQLAAEGHRDLGSEMLLISHGEDDITILFLAGGKISITAE